MSRSHSRRALRRCAQLSRGSSPLLRSKQPGDWNDSTRETRDELASASVTALSLERHKQAQRTRCEPGVVQRRDDVDRARAAARKKGMLVAEGLEVVRGHTVLPDRVQEHYWRTGQGGRTRTLLVAAQGLGKDFPGSGVSAFPL